MKRVLILPTLVCAAQAQPVQDASVAELVKQFAPTATRGLRNLAPEKHQIDLVINFDFDSTKLQTSSQPLLEKLAEALVSERLQALRYKVEGQTDVNGSVSYNEALSSRRAQAVLKFLQSKGVESGRLQAQGKGFSELLNTAYPQAAENLRVRVSLID